MEHKHSKKFKKNVNLPFAKVGLRVFPSLFAAETYCTMYDLDVDSMIEYGNSEELKNKVQKIAMIQKVVLRDVLEALDRHKEKIDAEWERAVKVRDNAEKTRDLLLEYDQKRVIEITAKNVGVNEARKIVWKMLRELEQI